MVNSQKMFIKGESEIVNFKNGNICLSVTIISMAHTDTYLIDTQRLIEIKLGENRVDRPGFIHATKQTHMF